MAEMLTADEKYMQRALAIARRAQGYVEPNPMVGCVVVRGGRIVGEGYHQRYGGPHAEVHALRAAGAEARGATLYVTLEPCCHYGKTPPCTEAVIAAGVKRVVAAMRDPFPRVAGKGFELLRKAGIEVEAGLLETESVRLNGPYIKLQRQRRPWVILKWAQSIDGRLATRTGDSKWISGEASRRRVHQIRARIDGIIVGVNTVLADDPSLTCRMARPRRLLTRLVLDPRLRTPLKARLVRTDRQTPTVIVTDRKLVGSARAKQLQRAGVEVMGVRAGKAGLDLGAMLELLGGRGMSNVMVEGGAVTLGRFYDAGLADEAQVFVSPRLIGGAEAPAVLAGVGPARMAEVKRPVEVTVKRSGEDLHYRVLLTDAREML